MSEPPCVDETPCGKETPCMDEPPCASGVFASVPECVLPSTQCVKGALQVEEAACARKTARVCKQPCGSEARSLSETPRVSAPAGVSCVVFVSEVRCMSERPCVRETACVRSLCEREMSVSMREHAAASPGVSVMSWCVSLVTRGSLSACVERRRRLRQLRDKGRVAAVVALGTAPGLHGSERAVHAVQRTRPPTCSAAGVRPGPGTPAVDEANPADGQRPGWVAEFGLDGFSTRAGV